MVIRRSRPGPPTACDEHSEAAPAPNGGPARIYDARVTYYEVLGVVPTATAAEIRRAYVDLARRHHPDFHTNASAAVRAAAERDMQRLNDAWEILGDPEQRRGYDDSLRGRDPGPFGPYGSGDDVAAEDGRWRPSDGRAHPDFVPLDDDDDPDYNARLDEIDDTPMPGARPVARWTQLLPVGLFVAALATLAVGLVVNVSQLLGLGVILFVLAGASFLVAPVMALLTGYERNPEK